MPAMSPASASSACESACPMPRTVPTNPIDGIAQMMYRIIELSASNRVPRASTLVWMASEVFWTSPVMW